MPIPLKLQVRIPCTHLLVISIQPPQVFQPDRITNPPKTTKDTLTVSGYRETGFVYAISAAGVAHSVSRACSMGRLLSCGCDPSSYAGKAAKLVSQGGAGSSGGSTQWKWGGCSHNLEYGMEFSKQFLDAREVAGDIQSTVNLHNNQAGRNVSISSFMYITVCIPDLR